MVDALDLKSNWYLNASAGSSPARGTLNPCKSIDYDLQGFFGFGGICSVIFSEDNIASAHPLLFRIYVKYSESITLFYIKIL